MNPPAQIEPLQVVQPELIANIEAEAALLGGMMQANQAIDRVADKLGADDFAEPLHGRIFSAIIKEYSQSGHANPVTVKPYFDGDDAMAEVGGPGYLAVLTGSGASVIGIDSFSDQVLELAQRRRLIASLRDVMASAADYDAPLDDLAADLETALAGATHKAQDGATELSAADCIGAACDGIRSQDRGVHCGIKPIDEAMGPIRKKNLAIVAGRPAMGKSAFASCYARGAAANGHGVLFVTLEMSSEEIGERLACDWTFDSNFQVPYEHVTSGKVSEQEMRQLARAQLEISELPFQVIDAANLPVHRLGRMVRRWKRRFAARGQSLDLVIVDYLQKLRAPGCSNRFEIITEISHTLKEIAKENDLGVMALSQLSREVEKREDKRPQMSDLRESGSIEQDADAIMFLFRQEYYLERSLPAEYDEKHAAAMVALEDCRGDIEFICAKRRKGRAGTAKGRFYGNYQAVRGCYE